ncbi:hypothetical protein BIW11_05242 [Tropilaelaps mercedesae]|uniref:Uncharacterized protein n=1 Tax=Tropilaelaps mercedesae TaxID=418985 RepID=A0A1V9Y367_9ACAR|nr:hypothetical protein BIW11_05242 [Tropilaelaps mercedesae]
MKAGRCSSTAQLHQTWRVLRRSSGRLLLSLVMSLQSLGHQLPVHAHGPPAEMDQWAASLNCHRESTRPVVIC